MITKMRDDLTGSTALPAPVGMGIARLFAGYGPKPLLETPNEGNPLAPQPKPQTPPVVTADDDSDDDEADPTQGGKFTVERMREDLERMRRREKKYRLERNAARAEIDDLKKAIPTAIDAAKSDLANAADARTIAVEVKAALRAEGIVDLDAIKLLDTSGLKVDANGEVVGLAELVEKAKTDKPYLFKAPTTTTTYQPPRPGVPAPKTAKEMSAEEYSAELARLTRRG